MPRPKSPVRRMQDRLDTLARRTKLCTHCGREQPATEFSYCAKTLDHRSARCRECDADAQYTHRVRRRCPADQPHVTETHCHACYGMSWRVQGPRCPRCGLEAAPEPGECIEVCGANRYWQEIEDES